MAIKTTLAELYKFGPGPSSSHTMGPMIAGFNFYKLMGGLTKKELAKADALEIVLKGSLSATGRGHGTDRAVLAGILGHSPDSCPPELLDELAADRRAPHRLSVKGFHADLCTDSVVYGPTAGDFPHPNTMTISLKAGEDVLLSREYYSTGGGFIEWQGYKAPEKPEPPYPYTTFRELKSYVTEERSLFDVLLANETALSGKSENEVLAFAGKVIRIMQNSVREGLKRDGLLPGSLKLNSKARQLFEKYRSGSVHGKADAAITAVTAMAIAAAEENARGHIICTAPTAGSAGVMAGTVHVLMSRHIRDFARICEGLTVAAAIGYICKQNATISGAEGGCQAEIGVASAMAAALLAYYKGGNADQIDNAAESALEHHLGLTCDPVGGYVQIPCIERCGFGIIKAWTASCIACEEIPASHKVSFDDCVEAMWLTAKAMPSKYKETSQGGLAQVLC
ncbi:L-serine ammonia-lyase [bacterium]|nr:L-serine ammonia-lyase [bacterium]